MTDRLGRAVRIILAVTAAVLLLAFSGAMAVEMDEYGAKYLKSDEAYDMIDVDIIDFKVRLHEMGFYSAGVSESTLQTRDLDDLTMAAVKLVCSLNPELTYYTDGVSNTLYWRVMGISGDALVTPMKDEYVLIEKGTEDHSVTEVQNRLNELGYDEVGIEFKAGVYDDNMQKVVDEFVRCNKLVYEEKEGVTVDMQERLFSDDAIVYTARPVSAAGFSEKVFTWLKTETNLFGIVILPNYVLLIVGFLLLCLIVLMIVKLVVPGGSQSRDDNKNDKPRADEIIFTVEYGNEKYIHRTSLKKYVRIGRATGDFPLNMSDESISRKHCEISYANKTVMLTDFSSYGTLVNGKMCHHGQQVLCSGDVIEIGGHRITVQFKS